MDSQTLDKLMDVAAGWSLKEKRNGKSCMCVGEVGKLLTVFANTVSLCLILCFPLKKITLFFHAILSIFCVFYFMNPFKCTFFSVFLCLVSIHSQQKSFLFKSCSPDCVAGVYFQTLTATLKGITAPIMTGYSGRPCICEL